MFNIRRKGQNVVEYAFVIAIISAAAVAMSTYVYRAVQSKQAEMSKEIQAE
jgi:Flp pilus assembly pilin Flp